MKKKSAKIKIFFKNLLVALLPPWTVYVLNLLAAYGFKEDLYWTYSWIDCPMHFLGGVSFVFTFCLLAKSFPNQTKIFNKLSPFLRIFLLVSMVTVVAVFWEFYELIRDTFSDLSMQLSLQDTMGDLFFGMLGSFLTAIFVVYYWRVGDGKKK